MFSPRSFTLAVLPLLLVSVCFSLRAEEPKAAEALVDNPEYAVWSKVAIGSKINFSNQKVNVMVGHQVSWVALATMDENEIVLVMDNPKSDKPSARKIPAKIAAADLPKDEATTEKKEFEFKDGTKITATKVIRKAAGQPDTLVWLSAEVLGGIVQREWQDPKHGTIVEKMLSFQIPGSALKEFKKYVPTEGAFIIEPEAPIQKIAPLVPDAKAPDTK